MNSKHPKKQGFSVRLWSTSLQPYKTYTYHCGINIKNTTMNYTFEQLPLAINKLHERLDGIEKLLQSSQMADLELFSELLTIQQASKFLNLSVPTLYSKVSRKEIPVNKKGKRLYFSKSELVKWVRSGRQQTEEEIQEQADQLLVSIHKKRK